MLLVLLHVAFAAPPAPPAWLAGCWSATPDKGGSYREVWLGPEGSLMVGSVLSVNPKGNAMWEHLRIDVVGKTLAYVASPVGQPTTVFEATEIDEKHAVFANPHHDFPQRITYTKAAAGISVRVEAKKPNTEQWQGFTLNFTECSPRDLRSR